MAVRLKVPISEEQVRGLHIGDPVLLSGTIFTGRDAAHKYMVEQFIKGPCPAGEQAMYEILQAGLAGGVIYHCGPVVRRIGPGAGSPGKDEYAFVAAGPTTSIREEPYQADVIEHFGLRAVIGKGGMRERTLQACRVHGAVYLHAIGGAAPLIAESVKEVLGVHKLEFGIPEAFWQIRVEDFPAVVTMDAHGKSLHEQVLAESDKQLQRLLAD
jgi:fumarate hydratase class I